MPENGAIRAVIFDLDGTLVESAPDLHVAANKLMAEHGRRDVTLHEITMMVGDGVPKLVERAFAATGDAVSEDDIPALAPVVDGDAELLHLIAEFSCKSLSRRITRGVVEVEFGTQTVLLENAIASRYPTPISQQLLGGGDV